MGKVVFQDPISHISGKISEKNCQTVYGYRKGSKSCYTQVRGDREKPATAEEMKVREKFRIVRSAVRTRVTNAAYLGYDQMAYYNARKAGDKHSTFHGWMFSKGWEYFDEGSNEVKWPNRL